MKDQHEQISGYRDLSQDEIDAVNIVKDAEKDLGEVWRQTVAIEGTDAHWADVAKTHFEEGFSALVRSIAKPEPRF